jgi:hypothetical protein
MRYYVIIKKDCILDNLNNTEIKSFEYSEGEPITPWAKACEIFGKHKVIEIKSEEDK